MQKSKLLLGVLIIACWSCNNQIVEFETILPDDVYPTLRERGIVEVDERDFLLMQIIPSVISSNSTNQFVIVNNTKYELYWNTIISLEHFEKNNWQPVLITGDWIDIGYVLYPGEIFSSDIVTGQMTLYSLVAEYNNGKKGKYRIVQKISIPELGIYELYAEFEII